MRIHKESSLFSIFHR